MSEAPAFEHVCQGIEARSNLDRLQARGTVRLALKEAGLDPASVTPAQLAVVLQRVLPAALGARGVEDAASVCDTLRASLRDIASAPAADTPEAVFARLGRGA
jgi:hypothetical protein